MLYSATRTVWSGAGYFLASVRKQGLSLAGRRPAKRTCGNWGSPRPADPRLAGGRPASTSARLPRPCQPTPTWIYLPPLIWGPPGPEPNMVAWSSRRGPCGEENERETDRRRDRQAERPRLTIPGRSRLPERIRAARMARPRGPAARGQTRPASRRAAERPPMAVLGTTSTSTPGKCLVNQC